MPVLFEKVLGVVVALEDPSIQAAVPLVSPENGIDIATQRSIITRMAISQQVNLQFLHTLGGIIYIYVFGDRMGQIMLSGLSFAGACNFGDVSHGAEKMLTWYKQNRASAVQVPTRVLVGTTAIDGFVTGFTEDVVEPATNIVQWNVTINTLPF